MGKNYANRKPKEERPESDFYGTPVSLVRELLNTGILDAYKNKTILEPCCGEYAISNELISNGFTLVSKDLRYGNNFLEDTYTYNEDTAIVTNPPFSLFDDFVLKAKSVAPLVCMIGKTNFFGA